MTTKLEHTSEPTASGFWVHALDCPTCQEQDLAEAQQADVADNGTAQVAAFDTAYVVTRRAWWGGTWHVW